MEISCKNTERLSGIKYFYKKLHRRCSTEFIESSLKVLDCFLFHLESYFPSQDIKVFVMTFWPCRKNDLI